MKTPNINTILKIDSLGLEELRNFMNEVEKFVDQNEVKNLTAGQVRTIYSIITDAKDAKELQLKRPELAFVAAKQDNYSSKEVIKFFIEIVKKATDNNFNNIQDFTATFLKYHKLYGNK